MQIQRPKFLSFSLLPLALLVVLDGCYNPNVPSGQQLCSNDGKCPDGYTCFPDNHCYVKGAAPDCSPACSSKDKPVCDKTSLKCVECLADTDCPAGGLCVTAMKICKMGCSAKHPGCASDAGSCDVDMGICRGCLSDAECTDTANPRCDAGSGRCVPCVIANDNCPNGQYCSGANGNFSCMNGCKVKADCQAANPDGGPTNAMMDCCNHQCVDTVADKANCGGCGKACDNGNVCCNGGCADVTTDVANCGGCGMPCMLVNVMGPTCSSSACGFTKCSPGFGDCDLKPSNGCETNIGMDPKNCGGCGNACGPFPNAIPGCMTATCTIASCMKGFSDCDGAVKTGCEIDSFNDVRNCGGCGNVCPNVVNGMPGCALGKCGVGTCNGNFRDCDMIAMNGCEANLLMDPKNCGGCGAPCNFANSSGTCTNGTCALGACNPGFGNCDGNAMNGCETSLNADVNNCGACANKCAMGLSCINAKCTLVCPAGKADCDGNQANGCETSTTSDPANCGACNALCKANVTCVNSACSGCQTGFADCDGNAANGCEVNLNTDAANCGKCRIACPMATPTCSAGTCVSVGCNPACINGGVCIANNQCGTSPHAPGTFGPIHTFVGLMSDFFISTGQGGCSVNGAQNAAADAQYFCAHFYGPNCTVKPGFTQTSKSGVKMHKNQGCTSLGTDIPNTVCDSPNAPGMACKMWDSPEVDAGLSNLICVCQ